MVHDNALGQTILAPKSLDRAGTFGVDIFFVISGFIIARVAFLDGQPTAGEFIGRRLHRIIPLYWLMSLPWLVAAVAIGPFYWKVLASTLTFWPAWGNTNWPLLGVGWTLSFEMLFYVCVAAVIWAGRTRLAIGTLLAFYVAAVASRVTGSAISAFLGNGMILEFLGGVVIAFAWRGERKRLGMAALGLGISLAIVFASWFALVPLASVEVFAGRFDFIRALMWGPAAMAIVWGALQFQPEGWLARRLDWLGGASYSIYLTHMATLWVFPLTAPHLHWSGDAVLAAGLILSIAAGAAVHQWVETPLLAAFRRPALPSRRAAIA
jgi:exopolysaccharide production protein ExoZ